MGPGRAAETTPRIRPHRWAVLAGTGLLAAALHLPAAPAQESFGDITIVKQDEYPTNAQIAVSLSQSTPLQDVEQVVISRDDTFADALASGVLQSRSPLMLVPTDGPVPPQVAAEIARLDAGRAVVLGGTGAVSTAVEQQLTDLGLQVERRAGASRIETAVRIAEADAPQATTAILARAFAADPANPSQGFADALSAGGWAADMGWPILLSDTDSLSLATAEHLRASAITHVMVLGGTAALSTQVEAEVAAIVGSTERVAGQSRFDTAIAVAAKRGAEDAADVERVTLVNGASDNAWAGGFAAAAHSAVFDAPIVLVDDVRLPPATTAFLQPAAGADRPAVTCVVHPLACEEGRAALGLPAFPLIELDPPRGTRVAPGDEVMIRVVPPEEGLGLEFAVDGDCLDARQTVTPDAGGSVTVTISDRVVGVLRCTLQIDLPPVEAADTSLSLTPTYAIDSSFPRDPALAQFGSTVVSHGDVPPAVPVIVHDRTVCTSPGGEVVADREDEAQEAIWVYPDNRSFTTFVGSEFVAVPHDARCSVTVEPPPGVGRVLWGVYSWSDRGFRRPYLLGEGTSATIDLTGLPDMLTDFSVRWLVEVNVEDPGTPSPQPPGEPSVISVGLGVDLECSGQILDPGGLYAGIPGEQCLARGIAADDWVLVSRPAERHLAAEEVEFTVPSDTRRILVRALTAPDALPPRQ